MNQELANVENAAGQMSREELELLYGAAWKNVDHKAEITIARMGIMQPGSPEVGGSVKGYEQGQIFDTMTREVLSSKIQPPWLIDKGIPAAELSPVHCIPVLVVFKLPTEYAWWTSVEERQKDKSLPKMLWKTVDANEQRVRDNIWNSRGGTWGAKNRPETHKKKPPVTDCINFLVQPLTPQYTPRCAFRVAPFSRSSAFCGKMLAGYINEKRMQFQPFWAEVIWLYTDKEQHPETGSWYNYYKMATGKPLAEVAPGLALQCKNMSLELANKETGEAAQLEILKLAVEDDSQHEVPNNEAPTGASTAPMASGPAQPQVDATADPFDGK